MFFTNYKLKLAALLLSVLPAGYDAAAQYCTVSTLYGCSSDYIQSFSTTGGTTNISTLNTGCTGDYTFYNTQTHTTQLSMTVNFTIVNCPSWTQYYKIWVDFNIDGDFTDPGEEVYTNPSKIAANATVTGSFVVPATASIGLTRLRIRQDYSAQPSPCGSASYGETQDYHFDITSPCAAPTGLAATNITSQTATVSWTPPTPSIGSEYAVDINPNGPTAGTLVTTNTANVAGLTPNTDYVLHVRNRCNTTAKSAWVNYPFKTLPPCKPPVNIKGVNLTPTSATVKWNKWPSASTYDYLVDQTKGNPTATTGIKNITDSFDNVTGLMENSWYYVHVRSRCPGGEISDWGLDSFLTPIPCRAPNVMIDHISTSEAVAYWEPVPTATHYEYAITTTATPPANGTKYTALSLHTSALNDGKEYYIHVRSACVSLGINGISPWGTTSFKTFPVGISNINANGDFVLEAYPNPVSNTLNVHIKGALKGNANITVTDMSGRVVLNTIPQSNKTAVDMGSLPAGVYLLKYNDDERSSVTRITKQ